MKLFDFEATWINHFSAAQIERSNFVKFKSIITSNSLLKLNIYTLLVQYSDSPVHYLIPHRIIERQRRLSRNFCKYKKKSVCSNFTEDCFEGETKSIGTRVTHFPWRKNPRNRFPDDIVLRAIIGCMCYNLWNRVMWLHHAPPINATFFLFSSTVQIHFSFVPAALENITSSIFFWNRIGKGN